MGKTAKMTELEIMQANLDALQGNFEGILDDVEEIDKQEKIPKKKLAKMVKEQEKAIALLKQYEEQKQKADDLIKSEKEKVKKARNHRLIQLGGIMEAYAGGKIVNKTIFAAWVKKIVAENGPIPGLESEKGDNAEAVAPAQIEIEKTAVKEEEIQTQSEDTGGVTQGAEDATLCCIAPCQQR